MAANVKNSALDKASELIKGVQIPAQPNLLVELDKVINASDSNLTKVGELIRRDVGLSATVLKAVNSPAFGLATKVASIPQAVALLGTSRLVNLSKAHLIRSALGATKGITRYFWNHSTGVALANTYLARTVPLASSVRPSPDEIYLLGLFHNCGLPLIMKKFPNYETAITTARNTKANLFDIEDSLFGVNHGTIGILVARSWGLPQYLRDVIQAHHRYQLSVLQEPRSIAAAAIFHLANWFVEDHLASRGGAEGGYLATHSDNSWASAVDGILRTLSLPAAKVPDLRTQVNQYLDEELKK